MKLYNFFISLFFITQIASGVNTVADGECNPVNILLGKSQSNDCCLESDITCENGHITEM